MVVPRIEAATIVENREMRRQQLIDAALSLAISKGAESVTVTAVARKAGLSRSAIYEYFSSSADLIADLILDELELYTNRLSRAVDATSDPFNQIEQWITEALKYIADGRHLLVKSLNSITTPEFRKEEIGMAHRRMLATIINPMQLVGFKDLQGAMAYVQSVVDAASIRIDSGKEKELEIQNAKNFALAGLRALALN
jgi:AcrR family transcriptional regulator